VKVRPHLVPEEHHHRIQRMEFWIQRFVEATGIPVHKVQDDDGPVVEPSYATWLGAMNMPKLNLNNPETRAYFLDITQYWLREFDTDGWRMDVVPHVVVDFWADFRRAALEAKGDSYLLAEVWGDCGYWTQGNWFDATMNYTFRHLCLEYFATADLSTAAFLDGYLHLTHMYAKGVTDANLNLLSSHDTARFLRFAGEEIQRLQLATLFQMTTPGAPSVYYGDEIGMTGGQDPDCRRAFPWDQPETWHHETLAMVRALAHLRKSFPALRLGGWELVWQQAEGFAFVREWAGQRVLVVMARQSSIADQFLPIDSDRPQHLWGMGKWHHRGSQDEGTGIVVDSLEAWSGLIIEL
jgi:neopullulanase